MPAADSPRTYEFQEPHVIGLGDNERITGDISQDHIGQAISALHRDGLVVLENAVAVEQVDKLQRILGAEAEDMAKLPTTHFNNASVGGEPTGNMSQGPPLTAELMYTDIWANKPAAAIISGVLGPSPRVNYVNGNTALAGFKGARQFVHADLTYNHATFPFSLVTNYYLSDVSPANGATELWLGSHRDTSFRDHRNCRELDDPRSDSNGELSGPAIADSSKEAELGIKDELLEKRRAFAPPIQPVIKKGSVVIRDLRLWHAGISNPSADARIMLAFVHTPWWYQCPARVVLPESTRPLIEGWADRRQHPIAYEAHFVDESVDHRTVKFTPNFSSENKGYINMLPKGIDMGITFG